MNLRYRKKNYDLNLAIKEYSSGKTLSEVGEIVGCSATNLSYMFRKNGVNLRRPNEHKTGKSYTKKKYRDIIQNGYKLIYKPEHPYSNANGRFPEHRYIMESYLGRYLTSEDNIHHKDGNKLNNKLENLILTNRQEHYQLYHSPVSDFIKKTGEKMCSKCKNVFPVSMFKTSIKKPFYQGRCKECVKEDRRLRANRLGVPQCQC